MLIVVSEQTYYFAISCVILVISAVVSFVITIYLKTNILPFVRYKGGQHHSKKGVADNKHKTIQKNDPASEATPTAGDLAEQPPSPSKPVSGGATPTAPTVDERLRRYLKKHPEDELLTSAELGEKINATDAAVRKTETWKKIAQKIEARKEMERIKLQLNNEYLPIEKREALNEELEALVKQVDWV